MKKKVLLLFFMCVLMLSVVACGKDNGANTPGQNESMQDEVKNAIDDFKDVIDSVSEMDGTGDIAADILEEIIDSSASNPTPSATTTPTPIPKEWFTTAETNELKASTLELSYRSAEKVAKTFVQAIATNEFEVAAQLMTTKDSPFVNSKDIAFSVPRSQYADIGADYYGEEVYLLTNEDRTQKSGDAATVVIDMYDKNDIKILTFDVALVISENNEWLVEDDVFYVTDFYFAAPSGKTKVTIDGVELGREWREGKTGYGNLLNLYKLPIVGRAKKTYRLASDVFDYSAELSAGSNNADSCIKVTPIVEGAAADEALTAVSEVWTNMYEYCLNNKTGAGLVDIFADNANPETFDGIHKTFVGSVIRDCKNHVITQLEKKPNTDVVWLSDDVVFVDFQYQLDWDWNTFGGIKHQFGRKLSDIALQKTDGRYKIHTVNQNFINSIHGEEW